MILIMHFVFVVYLFSSISTQVASISNALFIANEPSNELQDDSFFNETNPDLFLDDDTSLLPTDPFSSDVLSNLDDTTTFSLANANNPAHDCGSLSPSSFSPLKARSSSSSDDACQQNTATSDPNPDSDLQIFKKEDTVVTTQEQVERWWCSGNREQDRGKVPVCAFGYENQDVEIMLDGSLCSFFFSFLLSYQKKKKNVTRFFLVSSKKL